MISKLNIDQIINDADTIFHYTTFRKAIENILFKKQLRFPAINENTTNDPHEYRDRDIVFWSENLDIDIGTRLEVQHIINRIIKSEYKIACFCSNDHPVDQGEKDQHISLTSKRYGYDRLRIWSQYGENYYGVCIAFSRAALEKCLAKRQLRKFCEHVKYVDDLAEVTTKIHNIEVNHTQEEQTNDELAKAHINKNLRDIFFTKRRDYIDEAEFRVLVHDPDNEFDFLDISASVKAVLLGDRFNIVYRETVKKLCKGLNVECKKLDWRYGKLLITDI